jgi:hypothetical protein
MTYKPYERAILPLCPVAVKSGQTAVFAPSHGQWGVVTCVVCQEEFHIGHNLIFGSRINELECVMRFEGMLAENHRHNRAHMDSYEIPD